MIDPSIKLEDAFDRATGRVYMTGMQALVRLALLQAESDKNAGLSTAGLIGAQAFRLPLELLMHQAAAEGVIHSVRMVTRKPVRGLVGAPYLTEHNIAIGDITEPLRIFAGTPREAAIGFPANLNVSVALALAGIGPDRTTLEIWADPKLERNVHHIEVESDSARLSLSIENIPTDNPKTGRITALSVIAYLRKLGAPLRVGS